MRSIGERDRGVRYVCAVGANGRREQGEGDMIVAGTVLSSSFY